MALELLSVALGISTFAPHLEGRRVRVWSDNIGAEHGMRTCAAKSPDHNMSDEQNSRLVLGRKKPKTNNIYINNIFTIKKRGSHDNTCHMPTRGA